MRSSAKRGTRPADREKEAFGVKVVLIARK